MGSPVCDAAIFQHWCCLTETYCCNRGRGKRWFNDHDARSAVELLTMWRASNVILARDGLAARLNSLFRLRNELRKLIFGLRMLHMLRILRMGQFADGSTVHTWWYRTVTRWGIGKFRWWGIRQFWARRRRGCQYEADVQERQAWVALWLPNMPRRTMKQKMLIIRFSLGARNSWRTPDGIGSRLAKRRPEDGDIFLWKHTVHWDTAMGTVGYDIYKCLMQRFNCRFSVEGRPWFKSRYEWGRQMLGKTFPSLVPPCSAGRRYIFGIFLSGVKHRGTPPAEVGWGFTWLNSLALPLTHLLTRSLALPAHSPVVHDIIDLGYKVYLIF